MRNYKFNVGDEVRVVRALKGEPPKGTVGVVLDEHPVPYVKFFGYSQGHDAGGRLPIGSKQGYALPDGQLEFADKAPPRDTPRACPKPLVHRMEIEAEPLQKVVQLYLKATYGIDQEIESLNLFTRDAALATPRATIVFKKGTT